MTTPDFIALSAALIMGLSGAAHCFGMCGGVASAFGMRVQRSVSTLPGSVHAALYQSGRIVGYSVLGAVCGALGEVLQSLLDLVRIGSFLRVLSGVLLLLVAARLLWQWNGLAILERIGARLWKIVQPMASRLSRGTAAQTFALGLVWGFLPCGMVYSMLAFAALSGSALQGALLMAVFGFGTAPAMFFSILIAAKSSNVMRSSLASSPWVRRGSGVMLVAFAVWLMAAPFTMQDHSTHAGHVDTTSADSP